MEKEQEICPIVEENNVENTTNLTSLNIFSNIAKYSHEEYQYLNLLENILENGVWDQGRNGKTKSIFGHSMRFSLQNGKIPILTTKKMAWKTCLKELLWFISGKTNNNILVNQNVHIWDANASKEYLDSRGLWYYEDGELGPIYGHQWRHFNAKWEGDEDYTGEGIDQLQQIIDRLKDPEQRNSRRLILTAWNPCQLDKMALPPCHILCQFSVKNGDQLSCAMYQRSVDTFLGSCFNIASYSFFTHLLANHCGLKAHEFIYFMGDCHIYENAIDAAKTQILREPYPFPTLKLKQIRENINDYQVEDFIIDNYQNHEQIKVVMVV